LRIHDEIAEAYASDAVIPAERIADWIEGGDLEAWGLLYTLTRDAHDRIQPPLGVDATCTFLLNYYLRCIVENPEPADDLHSRFEAAWEMVPWLDHLWGLRPETDRVIPFLVRRVTETYLEGDPDIRNAIETGFLEHAFERPEFVPLFDAWRTDPDLRQAYEECLEWGLAHRGGRLG
jgi:hypothetical protein